MTENLHLKCIFTFSQIQGFVWSPVGYDAIHLSLVRRQMDDRWVKQYSIIGLW